MIGALVIAFVLLVFIPVSVFMTGGGIAALLGYFLKKDIEDEYAGTEWIDLA